LLVPAPNVTAAPDQFIASNIARLVIRGSKLGPNPAGLEIVLTSSPNNNQKRDLNAVLPTNGINCTALEAVDEQIVCAPVSPLPIGTSLYAWVAKYGGTISDVGIPLGAVVPGPTITSTPSRKIASNAVEVKIDGSDFATTNIGISNVVAFNNGSIPCVATSVTSTQLVCRPKFGLPLNATIVAVVTSYGGVSGAEQPIGVVVPRSLAFYCLMRRTSVLGLCF
jgi:hypothetical protein